MSSVGESSYYNTIVVLLKSIPQVVVYSSRAFFIRRASISLRIYIIVLQQRPSEKVSYLRVPRLSLQIKHIRYPRFARQVFIPEFFYYQGISLRQAKVNIISRTFLPLISSSIPRLSSVIPFLLIAFITLEKFKPYGLSIARNTLARRALLYLLIPTRMQQNPIKDLQAFRYNPKPSIKRRSSRDIVLLYFSFATILSINSRYSRPKV